jgi:signal transduction histidine kinase
MLFFMNGGYVGSIPNVFIIAIVFTVIMLEHRTALIMAALELIVYVGLFVFSYRHPETVIHFATEEQLLFDVSLGLISVGSALALTVWFQFRLYNRQQKQLEDANKRLSELDRMKTEFVQSISHELKIPLSNIRNYALDTLMELRREQLDIPAMEYDQKVIRAEGQRLIRMVSQLLDVAAIEGGRLKIHKEQLSLASLLRRVVDGNRTVLEANGNRAALEIADGLPDLTADPDAVEQILLNLIGNAARHTKEGMITISLSAGGGYQEICVTDTGEGIHPDVQSQVFMRYIERENKMSGHNGLGLYICKKLIDAHGGEIGIESGREKGAAVWFRLPTDK